MHTVCDMVMPFIIVGLMEYAKDEESSVWTGAFYALVYISMRVAQTIIDKQLDVKGHKFSRTAGAAMKVLVYEKAMKVGEATNIYEKGSVFRIMHEYCGRLTHMQWEISEAF